MGIGISVFLIALGAILAFAVSFVVDGVNLVSVGVILMVVGAIGLATSLFIWGPRRAATSRTVTYDDGYAPVNPTAAPTTRTVHEQTYHDTI